MFPDVTCVGAPSTAGISPRGARALSLGPALLHPRSWGDPKAWGGFPSPRRAGHLGRSSLNAGQRVPRTGGVRLSPRSRGPKYLRVCLWFVFVIKAFFKVISLKIWVKAF